MADIKTTYAADAQFTVTNLHSLSSSPTKIAGWTSASIDNATTNKYNDYLISGQFKVNNTTAPTTGGIEVWVYSSDNDTPTWPDLFSAGTEGTEGTATVHGADFRNCGLKFAWSCDTSNASTGSVYTMPKISIASLFGGTVPTHWAVFVTQNSGQSLHSTGNSITYQGIYHTAA